MIATYIILHVPHLSPKHIFHNTLPSEDVHHILRFYGVEYTSGFLYTSVNVCVYNLGS